MTPNLEHDSPARSEDPKTNHLLLACGKALANGNVIPLGPHQLPVDDVRCSRDEMLTLDVLVTLTRKNGDVVATVWDAVCPYSAGGDKPVSLPQAAANAIMRSLIVGEIRRTSSATTATQFNAEVQSALEEYERTFETFFERYALRR